MTQVAETALNSLLELSDAERAEIADWLYESLWKTKLNARDATAWETFLEQRIAEADRGDFAPGTPFDVIEETRRDLAGGTL